METRQFVFAPNDCTVIKISDRHIMLFVDASVPVEVLEGRCRRICARERRCLAYRRRVSRQEGHWVLRRVAQSGVVARSADTIALRCALPAVNPFAERASEMPSPLRLV